MDVPRVDDLDARVTGPLDQSGDRFDHRLAPRGVQRPVRMGEAVLHVDDDQCGGIGIERHTRK